MKHSRLTVVGALLLSSTPSQAAEVQRMVDYYTLRGTTLQAIDRELASKGPQDPATQKRSPAQSTVRFVREFQYVPGAAGCHVANVDVGLRLRFIQPQWKPAGRASKEVRTVVGVLSADIRGWHAQQARIAETTLRTTERELRALGPERTCAAMKAKVERLWGRYLVRHEAAQMKVIRRLGQEIDGKIRRALGRRG